jgi:hypothetical protein
MKLISLAISASLFSAAFPQTAPAQKLVDPDQIKRAVKNWVPDYSRT